MEDIFKRRCAERHERTTTLDKGPKVEAVVATAAISAKEMALAALPIVAADFSGASPRCR